MSKVVPAIGDLVYGPSFNYIFDNLFSVALVIDYQESYFNSHSCLTDKGGHYKVLCDNGRVDWYTHHFIVERCSVISRKG